MIVRVLAPGRAPLKPRARRCDNLPHGHERPRLVCIGTAPGRSGCPQRFPAYVRRGFVHRRPENLPKSVSHE